MSNLALTIRIARLTSERVASRIWQRDATLWSAEPEVKAKIANRLGWLDAPRWTLDRIEEISAFATEVLEAGFTSVVLLGMGGSSLGVEVIRDTLGVADGCPKLLVLDSTHPDQVRGIERACDLKHTLFILASKSGTTIEPDSFYRYFWQRLGDLGIAPDSQFCAITDPGTYLEELATREGFRKIFTNPADIGGRYSALSFFGMVPAAIIGADVREILTRAIAEADATAADTDTNEALALGAFMGSAALDGRDKLTLITDETMSSFGFWAEQLIAESTGKAGKGILPLEGETATARGEQLAMRAIVRLAVSGSEVLGGNASADELLIKMRDANDLGVQFFRWEFATAVSGQMLGINPFDEPNVTQSKLMTNEVLAGTAGDEVSFAESGVLAPFLESSIQGDGYVAIMAYLAHNPATIAALAKLRDKISIRYHVPVTVGFGPRFLHSTGQLHKGGQNTGTFIQLVDQPSSELLIPGKPFGFRALIHAQASGDAMALRQTGRKAIRIDLGPTPLSAIEKLTEGL